MAKTMNAIGERLSTVGMKFAPHPHLWSTLLTRAEIGQIMETTNPTALDSAIVSKRCMQHQLHLTLWVD